MDYKEVFTHLLNNSIFQRCMIDSKTLQHEFLQTPLITELIETYHKVPKRHKKQILSVLTVVPRQILQRMIPSLTNHQYYDAKRYGKFVGVCFPRVDSTIIRKRISRMNIEDFIKFLLRKDNVNDIAWGSRSTVSEVDDSKISIPNYLRKGCTTYLILKYQRECQDNGVECPHEKYLRKIINIVVPKEQQNFFGLDTLAQEGKKSLDNYCLVIKHMTEKEIFSSDERDVYIQKIEDAKHHMKNPIKTD